jgi:hypothetical protein
MTTCGERTPRGGELITAAAGNTIAAELFESPPDT